VDLFGVGIKENPGAVKGVAGSGRSVWAVDTKTVTEVERRVRQEYVPDITCLVVARIKGNLPYSGGACIQGNDQRDSSGVAGKDGKVDALRGDTVPQRQRHAWLRQKIHFHLEMVIIIIIVKSYSDVRMILGWPIFSNRHGGTYGFIQQISDFRYSGYRLGDDP
jgi:hypothetical protein